MKKQIRHIVIDARPVFNEEAIEITTQAYIGGEVHNYVETYDMPMFNSIFDTIMESLVQKFKDYVKKETQEPVELTVLEGGNESEAE